METIQIAAQNTAQRNPVILGTTAAAGDGTFTFTSTMPSAPDVPRAVENGINMYMYATGITSRLNASTSFDAGANVIPTPSSAQIGQAVALNGGGFGSKEIVTIKFQDTEIATAKTDNNGAFKATVTVPSSAQAGYGSCNLWLTGNISGVNVGAAFTFLPTITMSPQKGPSGTSIVVKGVGLYIYDGMNIYWFDPKTNTQTPLTNFGMNGSNTFQVTVTAPSNLTSGKIYDVQVEGGSGLIAQLPFKVT